MENATVAVKETSKIERVSYPLFAAGQNLIYGFITAYLSVFLTDNLLIMPAVVSVIFLIAKVWDAVNDPLFGIIVDRVNFKKNKFTPWLKVTSILVPILTMIMFFIPPSLSMGAKIALAAILYLVWSMAYTVSDVPAFSLMTSMTGNVHERASLLSRGSIASTFAALLLVVGLVPLIPIIGFPFVGIIVSCVALPLMVILPRVAKERNRTLSKTKVSVKEIFKYFKSNKYLTIFYAAHCINGVLNVSLTLINYVMIYCLGSLNYLAIFTAIGVVPLILIYLCMPLLIKKFDRMTMYKFCIIVNILLSVLIFFIGYKIIPLYGFLAILRTVISTPTAYLASTFTTDCVEYGHYKSGVRREGITFSVQTFANKLTAAISGSLALMLLSLIGYVPGVAQTTETLSLLWACANLIPALGAILSLPVLFFYKLKSKTVQIMADCNSGKITKEESEKLL